MIEEPDPPKENEQQTEHGAKLDYLKTVFGES